MQYKFQNIPSRLDCEILLPSSKSVSNRLLIISALSGNRVKVKQLSDSDDTALMMKLLNSSDTFKDAGHAGTTMRFLTAFYATGDQEVVLSGSERMKQRPIKELVDSLILLGADIEYLENPGFPPLKIRGKKLRGGEIKINSGVSSQYISALLMIAPLLRNGLKMQLTGDTISSSYIDMTLTLMKQAGASVLREGNKISVSEGMYTESEFTAEPDWSSASYWFMLAGLHQNSRILLRGMKAESCQGDATIRDLFLQLGVDSIFLEEGLLLQNSSPVWDEFIFDFRNIPDMVQSFIPYCIARNIPFRFSGCRTLRIKETDRVQALYQELFKFGVEISFTEDGDTIWWKGDSQPDWERSVTVNTYKDHRMALAFAPLSVLSPDLKIDDPAVVSKSYPGYWKDLSDAGFSLLS